LSNLVEELGNEFDLWIVTRDRDHTDTAPYVGVPLDEWVEVGKAKVFYGRPRALRPWRLAHLIKSFEPDLVVLNSFHSQLTITYLTLRRLKRSLQSPILLAPRGEFAPSAMLIKKTKKRAYMGIAKFTRLVAGVHWQASSVAEEAAISAKFPGACVHVVPDLPKRPNERPSLPQAKKPGSVTLVFVSRVSRMKNLPLLLAVLADVEGAVTLEIYGPKEVDEWDAVVHQIGSLPDNVQVEYLGVLKPEEVDQALEQAHFFVLPTLGENFGHAIFEALSVGRPVVISDRTPWRGLEALGCGWDLPLESRGLWVDALQKCVDMDDAGYRTLSEAAHRYATRWFEETNPAAEQAKVLRSLLAG
jgi:glycosyltransferase involved in cell wall biosynthesis